MQKTDLFAREKYLSEKTILAEKRQVTADYSAHSHDFFEIELVASGTGRQILNGTEQTLSAGDIYFLTPEDVHSVYPENGLTLYNIMFTEEFLSPSSALPALLSCHGKKYTLSESLQEKILPLLCQLVSESAAPLYGGTEYMQGLMRCVFIILLRAGNISDSYRRERTMGGVLFYLQRSFKENITLKDAARYANMSAGYFCEQFKRVTGTGFNAYITDLRLTYAARLLIDTDESITEVCFKSGFSSFSSFSRAFREKFKTTPREYRKK